MFKKKKRAPKEKKFTRIIQMIFIEVPVDIVGPQAMKWGESEWWPKKCAMRFIRETGGEVDIGTKFLMKIQRPLGPKRYAEVTRLVPNHLIERTFSKGMFEGRESIYIEERSDGTKVEYVFLFAIKGLLNKFLWKFLFRKQHERNINLILDSLKMHVLKVHHSPQSEGGQ